jgi:hypothetical protein
VPASTADAPEIRRSPHHAIAEVLTLVPASAAAQLHLHLEDNDALADFAERAAALGFPIEHGATVLAENATWGDRIVPTVKLADGTIVVYGAETHRFREEASR